jgi:hypothetical protein
MKLIINYKKINKNKKAAANIIAIVMYTFLTLAVIALVANFANEYVIQYQEQYKYNTMITEIYNLNLKLNTISNNKLNSEIINVNNSEYLEIDCTNNIIKGYISYNNKYKDSNVYVQGINTYKKYNKIYFEKQIDINNSVNLYCRDLVLNKGRNNLEINYFDFNESSGKVNIDIQRYKNTRNNFWYNSNWPYRSKITINSEDVNEDLTNYPLYLKIEDYNILKNINTNGNDIVFTKDNGKTKLEREIENVNNTILPYYIEEDIVDNNYNIWTKVDVLANSKKTIYLEKTNGYTPNGNNVFLFFDNFNSESLDTNKWDDIQYVYGSGSTSYIDNNQLYIYAAPGSYTLFPTKYEFENSIIEYKLKTIRGAGLVNPDRSIFWRFQDIQHFYFGGWECWVADTFSIGKNNNSWVELSRSSAIYEDDLNWHKFVFTINNNNFILNYDGSNILNINDSSYSDSGAFGFILDGKYSTSRDVDALVDDVFVRKYIEEEPIIIVNEIDSNLYKIDIINNSNENLEDYQIEIPNNIINVNSDTESLKITDSEFIGWVKIPELSSSEDTDIYIYYGNNNANEINSNYVWNTDYVVVQHLNESPENNIIGHFDSTINNINGTAKNFDNNAMVSTTNASSKTNRSNLFDGINDYIDLGTINNGFFNKKISIESWIKIKENTNYNGLTTIGSVFPVGQTGIKIYFNENGYTSFIVADGIDRSTTSFSYNFEENKWYHLLYTAEIGNSKKLYVNGELEDTKDISTLTGSLQEDLTSRIVTSDNFNGYISNFIVSNIIKTPGFIKTQYNNQNNINSFITILEPEDN